MDIKEIRELMKNFDNTSLTHFEYKNGEEAITFKRVVQIAAAPAAVYQNAPAAMPAASVAPATETATAVSGLEVITSPIVGTFYRSPAPDAPAYVEAGQSVKEGDVICIIEAMKLMNNLESELNCEIVNILVENGTMIEYGTPLFEVKKL